MSKYEYEIDEKGDVTRSVPGHKTRLGYTSEHIDKMISNGKFTEDEVKKIRANRLAYGQKLIENDGIVTNPGHTSSESHTEEPLPLPAMNFDKDDTEQKQNVNVSDVKGEQPLEIPSTA